MNLCLKWIHFNKIYFNSATIQVFQIILSYNISFNKYQNYQMLSEFHLNKYPSFFKNAAKEQQLLKKSYPENKSEIFEQPEYQVDKYLCRSKEEKKNDLESSSQFQSLEPYSLKTAEISVSPIEKLPLNTTLHIEASQQKQNISMQKKKPDYKKNICGYVSKIIVKQATSKEYTYVVEKLCQKYNVSQKYFNLSINSHQTITGPTHLYTLLTPKLNQENITEWLNEINLKIVLISFFRWFLRHRYIRYIMNEGKMERKGQYLCYKNKELLYLITEEWKELLKKLKKQLKNQNKTKNFGDNASQQLQQKYIQLFYQNTSLIQQNVEIEKVEYQPINFNTSFFQQQNLVEKDEEVKGEQLMEIEYASCREINIEAFFWDNV